MLKLPKQIKMGREKPLIEPLQVDTHRHLTPPNPKSSQQDLLGFVNRAIGPCTEDQDYIEKIKQLQAYLDMVKKIVKPGCSQEVLKSSDFQATRVYEAKEIITLIEG